ncbi:hypothetical protein NBRC116583_00660 [Arenicella sp. 4NH20-0111]|uniref:hypothetical protein n=1 Tax=Arenicella sp. 4NH20-0111 TaxID=3127648 RepID=UPI00310820D9
MKILSNPEAGTMICVLPNGVTVEVSQVNLYGTKSDTEQSVEDVMHVVSKLPSVILSNKPGYAA